MSVKCEYTNPRQTLQLGMRVLVLLLIPTLPLLMIVCLSKRNWVSDLYDYYVHIDLLKSAVDECCLMSLTRKAVLK